LKADDLESYVSRRLWPPGGASGDQASVMAICQCISSVSLDRRRYAFNNFLYRNRKITARPLARRTAAAIVGVVFSTCNLFFHFVVSTSVILLALSCEQLERTSSSNLAMFECLIKI